MFLNFPQHGDRNLENVTHEEAVATLKATQERVLLVVGKSDPPLAPASPQPCKTSYTFIKKPLSRFV